MFSGRRIVQNMGWLTVSPLLRVLVGVPLAGVIARQLGVQGYGELNFALAFAALFAVVANLGLNETFLRAASRQAGEVPRAWTSVLLAKAALLGGYLAVLFVLAAAFGHPGRMVALILLMGVCTGALSIENAALALFSARQRMKPVAALGAVKFIVEVGVMLVVLFMGATALGLTASRAAVAVLAIAGGLVLARRQLGARFASPSAAAVRPLLRSGVSFAAITVLWAIQARAGVLLLGHTHGLEAVALFSAAMVPVERLFMFFPVIQDALYPVFSAFATDEPSRFEAALARSIRYQCLFAVGLGLAVSLGGPWALTIVFPAGLHGAGAVLEVLGIAVTLRALNVLFTTATTARGLERAVVWAAALHCMVLLAFGMVLIAPFGAIGLAWAATASEAAFLAVLGVVLWRRHALRSPHLRYFFGPAACAVVVFAVFAAVSSGRDGVLLPLVFAASYPVVLVMSRAVSREDLGYLRAALGPRPS